MASNSQERRKQEEALSQAEEKATLDPMTQIKNKKAIELITRARVKEAAEKNTVFQKTKLNIRLRFQDPQVICLQVKRHTKIILSKIS